MLLPIEDFLQEKDIEYVAIRSSGPGGQHVNKVSTGVLLRFDIEASSLPPDWKQKLRERQGKHISSSGVVAIKSTRHRSQLRNRKEAKERLMGIISAAIKTTKKRKATKPPPSVNKKRLERKNQRSHIKASRKPPMRYD